MKILRIFLQSTLLAGAAAMSVAFNTNNDHIKALALEPSSTQIEQEKNNEQEVSVVVLGSPLGFFIGIILVGGVGLIVAGITYFRSSVAIGDNEVGLIYKKFAPFSGHLSNNQVVALNGEEGYQAEVLSQGRHPGYWPWQYIVYKEPCVEISPEQIGIVEAKDGEPLERGSSFGKVVECNHFQDAAAFFEGGQRGKQQAILTAGTYRINTRLFQVTKRPVVEISAQEIGIVIANDGEPIPPGRTFGKVVECNYFQDAHDFLEKKGQEGKQLAILTTGSYYINTELFSVYKKPVTQILPDEIGLVEAKDGETLPSGNSFGKIVPSCNNFQNAQAFIDNGGQRGNQLAILTEGTYQINTEVFKVRKVPVTCIDPGEVGLVEAKYGAPLTPGRIFANVVESNEFQDTEAFLSNGGQKGKQLTILAAGTYRINTNLFRVYKQPVVNVSQGEIALVVAKDGANIPPEKILGKVVECNDFQHAEAFINNGGQKGKQLAILTAGEYHINTELFTIITAANARKHGVNPQDLQVYEVGRDNIGIVTTKDGIPTPETGEIAGPYIKGHNGFQEPQKFIDGGGYRGLQEEFLTEGRWNLNPWFVKVEQVSVTTVEPGTVGVVISHIGKTPEKIDDEQTEHQLVESGYKGVQKVPLPPGKYPINTRVQSVEVVPTHEITLDWSNDDKPSYNYDAKLNSLKLRSKDGFEFAVEVTQVIRIAEKDAPKMISRIGSLKTNSSSSKSIDSSDVVKYNSIKNLVTRVLGKMVVSHFGNSANGYDVWDFIESRGEREKEAFFHIKSGLGIYGVQAIETLIYEIELPPELEKLLKERKLVDEQRKTYQEKLKAEKDRQKWVEAQQETKNTEELIDAENKAKIASYESEAYRLKKETELDIQRQENKVETDKLRTISEIEREDKQHATDLNIKELRERVKNLSPEIYATMTSDEQWAKALSKLKISCPEVFISGGGNGQSGGMEMLQSSSLGLMHIELLREQIQGRKAPKNISKTSTPEILTPSPAQPSLSATNTEPRFPLVLLVDTSSSISSQCLSELIEGITTFKREILQDPTATSRIEVAVLTFGGTPQLVHDFSSVETLAPPQLKANGDNFMGQGIKLALQQLESRQNKYKQDGLDNYSPWVFSIVGSTPTDSWQHSAQLVQQEVGLDKLHFFVVGVQEPDTKLLGQITSPNTPVMLDGWKFPAMFHWLAESMQTIAHKQIGVKAKLPNIDNWAKINNSNH